MKGKLLLTHCLHWQDWHPLLQIRQLWIRELKALLNKVEVKAEVKVKVKVKKEIE